MRPNLILISFFVISGCAAISERRKPQKYFQTYWEFNTTLSKLKRCLGDKDNEFVVDRWGGKVRPPIGSNGIFYKGEFEIVVKVESEGYTGKPVHSEANLLQFCPLPLYGKWTISARQFEARKVHVLVSPEELKVHNYKCLYIGHPWNCAIPVAESTLEEYRILKQIGECLGEAGMPEISVIPGTDPDPKYCK